MLHLGDARSIGECGDPAAIFDQEFWQPLLPDEVGHFGRLETSDEYSHLFFNTFRDSIVENLDNASWARSESDLLFLDIQMTVLQ